MPAVLLARAARRRWLPSTTASARSSLGRGTSARTRSQTAGSSSCASACRARRATVGGSARPADACAAGGRRAAGGADTCTTAVDSSHEAQAGSGGASASAGGAKSQARQVRAFGFWVWRGPPEASPGAALTPCRPRLDPEDAEQRGQLVDQELRVRRLQVRAAARAPPAARGRPRPLDTLWPSRPPARARTGWAALTRALLCGSRPSNSVAPQAVLPAPALPGGAPSWRPADPQSGPRHFSAPSGRVQASAHHLRPGYHLCNVAHGVQQLLAHRLQNSWPVQLRVLHAPHRRRVLVKQLREGGERPHLTGMQ